MMPTCSKKGCDEVAAYLSEGERVAACYEHKRWFNRKVRDIAGEETRREV